MSTLTIGIDARAASEVPAGRGRVVRELLRALTERDEPHRYRCYARTRWDEVRDERLQWELIDARDPGWHLRAARRATRECDVFLSTNSYLTGWFLGIPDVVIVHDLLALDRAMPANRRSAVIERITMGRSIARATALMCYSQATAGALRARFPGAADRITIAPLGASTQALGDSSAEALDGLPASGFVLAVGTLEPRKNLPRLVDAYARLAPQLRAEHKLVVVGALGWQTGETLAALQSLGADAIRLGHVSDPALAELYRRCAVFCYPSLGEGFGLPVLEAMQAGAAVLTSNVSSLPEVGGDAVAYCDPLDMADIQRGLRELLLDPSRRADLGARGVARAASFSWNAFAEATLGTLERAAGGDQAASSAS